MAKIDRLTVDHLAKLARIKLGQTEAVQMEHELTLIVEFVERLQSVDAEGSDPTNQVTGLIDVWRPDEVRPSPISRDDLLANAPEQKDGYIKVRRVL